jgi:hypothetical protein
VVSCVRLWQMVSVGEIDETDEKIRGL